MRIAICVKLVLLCFFAMPFASLHAQGQPPKPNVLFFVVDDLRTALGCYGDTLAITPHIDELAQRGVVFAKAYCQQAVCNPSRASMLTGLRPDETGVINLQAHFRQKLPDLVTLPQLFKNNGYSTIGLGKIFHASSATLDSISWSMEIPHAGGGKYLLPKNQGGAAKMDVVEAADVADNAYNDGKIAEKALTFLNEFAASQEPFFLSVGFNKPHAPFCAPQKYWDLYDGVRFEVAHRNRPNNSPEIAYHDWQELRGYKDVPSEGEIPDAKEQEIWQGYYACVSYIDAQIGMVLARLDSLGLRENTIVVLWGDHGYHLGEQNLWCKSANFELTTRVPTILSAPGMSGNGKQTQAIVETVDIYPTLADLCDLAIPKDHLSGLSMKPLLEDPDLEWGHVAFSQFVRPYDAIFIRNKPIQMGYSVRVPGWRCTYWFQIDNGQVVEKELYRYLSDESLETDNLAGKPEFDEIESKLAALIADYRTGAYEKSEIDLSVVRRFAGE